jgi:hypothetical protein
MKATKFIFNCREIVLPGASRFVSKTDFGLFVLRKVNADVNSSLATMWYVTRRIWDQRKNQSFLENCMKSNARHRMRGLTQRAICAQCDELNEG